MGQFTLYMGCMAMGDLNQPVIKLMYSIFIATYSGPSVIRPHAFPPQDNVLINQVLDEAA